MTHRRNGVSLIYCTMIMTAMLAITSLAVDLGRVQVAKTEMRRAATSAARASAAGLSTSLANVQALAQAYAQYNSIDGGTISFDTANDVAVGTWDPATKTFTPTAFTSATAVQITLRRTTARGNAIPLTFASVIGRSSFDVTVKSVATTSTSGTAWSSGIIGLNGFTLGSHRTCDSYKSANGAYSTQTPGNLGSVACNGTWSLASSCTIRGNAYYRTSSAPTGGTVNSRVQISSDVTASVATLPQFYTEHGDVDLGNHGTLTLSSGNHHFGDFSIGKGTLTIDASTGPVRIYVSGTLDMRRQGNVNTTSNLPANLEIHLLSNNDLNFNLTAPIYGVIDAPLADVTFTSGDLYGSVIGGTISVTGAADLHYDESLNNAMSGGGSGSAGIGTAQ